MSTSSFTRKFGRASKKGRPFCLYCQEKNSISFEWGAESKSSSRNLEEDLTIEAVKKKVKTAFSLLK